MSKYHVVENNMSRLILFHALTLSKDVIPSVLAILNNQEKIISSIYSISVFLKDPIPYAEVFLLLSFRLDIEHINEFLR